MKVLRIIVHLIRNKYLVASLAFFIWILVFDKNNLISQYKLISKLHKLQKEEKFYKDQIRQDEIATYKLLNDPYYLEKLARERYLMKRDSEDIFLIVHPDSAAKK